MSQILANTFCRFCKYTRAVLKLAARISDYYFFSYNFIATNVILILGVSVILLTQGPHISNQC